jgi:hypothetical protein
MLNITYPELEAEERRAFHKRQQLAEPLTHLFIYLLIYFPFCHHAKPNTDFMFQLACFHLVFGVNSVHLSSPHGIILCSFQALPTL